MPKTLRLNAHRPGDLDRAADILRSGGTVAFPTETVYGLGANALHPAAVASIFAAKQRPAWDPLIVHIADTAQLAAITSTPAELQHRVDQLAEAFWPGPLTLLLPRSSAIPDSVTAARPLVGVRIPGHPIARQLLRLTELPIAAPSANTFGHTSPTTAAHVLADLDGRIDAVLEGGPSTVGVESTVLDPAGMTVYRPGAVTLAHLREATGRRATLFVPPAQHVPEESLPSPGVGIRHYAPRARLLLVDGNPEALMAAHHAQPHAGILLPTGWGTPFSISTPPTYDWGDWNNPQELARNLFAGLRSLDAQGVTQILCPVPSPEGVGAAIRDRLEKAAREG